VGENVKKNSELAPTPPQKREWLLVCLPDLANYLQLLLGIYSPLLQAISAGLSENDQTKTRDEGGISDLYLEPAQHKHTYIQDALAVSACFLDDYRWLLF
jgi:hypothetical protein